MLTPPSDKEKSMKFRYYITSLHEGVIKGTNEDQVAIDLASSEDYFVVNSESGEWLLANGRVFSVEDIED